MAIILRGASNSFWTYTLSRECRLLRPKMYTQKAVQFASLRDPLPKHEPIQYSSSKASKITIAEIFGFNTESKRSLFRRIGLAVVLSGVIIYIYTREENEYDEIFKYDEESLKRASELLDLKLKLQYCITNNLPTDALIAKINELEKDKTKPSPFRV